MTSWSGRHMKQSGSGGRARSLGRQGVSRRRRRTKSATQAHAVRRLSRTRLGLSRDLQARSQRQSARSATTTRSRTTIREKFAKAVHLKDVHLAHGMQCADCHFDTDVHGNGMLYGEPRNATTIKCIDCHGTIDQRPTLITSGNAGQIDLLNNSNTPLGPRFVWEGNEALPAIDHVARRALGNSANDRHD